MAKVEVLAEQSSDVSLQGDTIRNRVPSNITISAGGEVGDAIDWQVLTDGTAVWIVGAVAKGQAVGKPSLKKAAKKSVKAPAKAGAKKSARKGGKKTAQKSDDLSGAFEEDWGDDAPTLIQAPVVKVPRVNAPSVKRPTKSAGVRPVPQGQVQRPLAPPVPPRTVAARSKGGKYQMPIRR